MIRRGVDEAAHLALLAPGLVVGVHLRGRVLIDVRVDAPELIVKMHKEGKYLGRGRNVHDKKNTTYHATGPTTERAH
jgi:hypothetical protein